MKESLQSAGRWRRMNVKKNKSHGKNKENLSSIKLIGSAAVFLLLIIVVMSVYAIQAKHIVRKNVIDSIMMTTRSYSVHASHDLDRLKEPAMLAASLLEQNRGTANVAQVTELLKQLCANTDAYMALYVNPAGKGTSNLGAQVDIGTGIVQLGQGAPEVKFYYVEDDRVTGEPALVITFPVDGKNNDLLAYYKLETLMKYSEVNDFDGSTWSSVVKADGSVLYTKGKRQSNLMTGENLFAQIEESLPKSKYDDIVQNVEALKETYSVVQIGDNETFVVLVPLGINDWYFAMGIGNTFVNRRIAKEWNVTKRMIFVTLFACIAFATVILAYIHVNNSRFKLRSVDLQNKADTDLLTELNNKMATERKIKEYIQSSQGQGLLFVFDIDNFKKINDTRGHAFGDEVLRNIGHRLRTEFRSSDIVGRAGGDEFILFLKDIRDDEIMKKEADRVAGLFKDFKVGQYTKYSVTASIGCAVYPRDADSFEDLYKAADKGLYKAKQRGKNQLAFYQDEEEQV